MYYIRVLRLLEKYLEPRIRGSNQPIKFHPAVLPQSIAPYKHVVFNWISQSVQGIGF